MTVRYVPCVDCNVFVMPKADRSISCRGCGLQGRVLYEDDKGNRVIGWRHNG